MQFRFEPGTSPALLLLHGTGGDENDLIPLGQLIRPGAALLSPRGEVNENGQLRFFRRLAPGVFDLDDLIRRTHTLADFVEEQSERHHLRKIVAVGYSNGANIAASMLLLRPGILSGAILLRTMVPLEPPHPPDLGDVPVLIIAGRHDEMMGPDRPQRLAALLLNAGAEVTLDWLDTGHGLGPADVKRATGWLDLNFPS
ncbi:MAG: alpha/beta hydrolase [Chthoniobacterales bacterium]